MREGERGCRGGRRGCRCGGGWLLGGRRFFSFFQVCIHSGVFCAALASLGSVTVPQTNEMGGFPDFFAFVWGGLDT